MERQEMFYPRWCWLISIISIIVVIIIMGVFVYPDPCPSPCPGSEPVEGAAHLVVVHEDLVAFSQINNSFSSQYSGEAGCTDLKNAWSGLLFQLGDYAPNDCAEPDGVDITLNTGEVISFDTSEFDWINIVGARPELDASAVPMLPSELYKIMPPRSVDSACKGAPIHSKLVSVSDIITFWQGSNGYDFKARLTAPADDYPVDGRQNSYGVRFNDDFEVWVYKIGDGCAPIKPSGHDDSAYLTGDSMHLTNVAQIRVKWKSPGVGSGVRVDPPMP